jgi:hypothetical protein
MSMGSAASGWYRTGTRRSIDQAAGRGLTASPRVPRRAGAGSRLHRGATGATGATCNMFYLAFTIHFNPFLVSNRYIKHIACCACCACCASAQGTRAQHAATRSTLAILQHNDPAQQVATRSLQAIAQHVQLLANAGATRSHAVPVAGRNTFTGSCSLAQRW